MSLYESVIIVRQETSTQQVEDLADNLENIIKENGGSIKKRENWGLRALAYKIKKNRKGHYLLFNIDAPANAVRELERLMQLNEDILRYLTLKVDELEEGASIPAQNLARLERASQNYDNNKVEESSSTVADKNNGESLRANVEQDDKLETTVEGES